MEALGDWLGDTEGLFEALGDTEALGLWLTEAEGLAEAIAGVACFANKSFKVPFCT